MKKSLLLISATLFAGQLLIAQSVQLTPTVIASAGGYAENNGISLSWTLGEVAVTTLSADGMVLTQGFQQAFDIGNSFKLDPINWQIIAYPNPVRNELRIQFDVNEPTDFLIEIQDAAGRLLSQEQYNEIFPGDIIPVEMSSYKSGMYFFRISTTDRKQVRVISIRRL